MHGIPNLIQPASFVCALTESVARYNTEEYLKSGRSGIEAPEPESEGRRRRQGRWIDPLPAASEAAVSVAASEAAVAEARATAALGFLSPSGSRVEAAHWDVVPQEAHEAFNHVALQEAHGTFNHVAPQEAHEPFKVRWPALAGLSTSPIPLSPSHQHAGFQFRGALLRLALRLKGFVC